MQKLIIALRIYVALGCILAGYIVYKAIMIVQAGA